MLFIILPHQLFDKKYLDKSFNYLIWEHPNYFTKYNFNKKKLIMHRASMKYYFDYLKKNKFNVEYLEFNKKCIYKKYILFDPIDKIKLLGKIKLVESPNFILTKEQYQLYRKKSKSFFFYGFYLWGKKQINLIPKVKSQDKLNRERFNNKIKIPKIVSSGKDDKKYINEAIKYINIHFKNNYGNTNNFIFPVTHKTAKRWLKNFITKKLKHFGPYEDFINKNNQFMFHSVLSSSINIGLINPLEIFDAIKSIKDNIPINSYEGYIRQLFWREYQRFCYIHFNFFKNDYFGNKNKLTKDWYNGTLGIKPVDDCIIKGFDSGYLHHIERLMIIGNFMNLCQIKPNEGLKWFMEFSCDSYEWVMYQNVLDMVFCVSGGKTTKKPYITSGAYIIKMSNYKKGEWSDKWYDLYKKFMIKHKKKLLKDFKYYFHFIKNY